MILKEKIRFILSKERLRRYQIKNNLFLKKFILEVLFCKMTQINKYKE